jgi:hypothetical protein
MRIVSMIDFLELPAGIIFQRYRPVCFDELMRKEESLRDATGKLIDFSYTRLSPFVDVTQENIDNPKDLELGVGGRWGYQPEASFAVYNDADILKLISLLCPLKD